jgi:hypothetical protein
LGEKAEVFVTLEVELQALRVAEVIRTRGKWREVLV